MSGDDSDQHPDFEDALSRVTELVELSLQECKRAIVAYLDDGPDLVGQASARLQRFRGPGNKHDPGLNALAEQVEQDINKSLPYIDGVLVALARLVLGLNDTSALLMKKAVSRLQELQRGMLPQLQELQRGMLPRLQELQQWVRQRPTDDVPASFDEMRDLLAQISAIQAQSRAELDAMAASAIIVGTEIAEAFGAIAGYIYTRRDFLITYIDATDYFAENSPGENLAKASAILAAVEVSKVAAEKYLPLVLPKLAERIPMIGMGIAFFDLVNDVREKRKQVEERRSLLQQLAAAKEQRSAADEIYWLNRMTNGDPQMQVLGDRQVLQALISSTETMLSWLKGVADQF